MERFSVPYGKMSRIGKKEIIVPSSVKVEMKDRVISVSGPRGSLKKEIHPRIDVLIDGGKILFKRQSDEKRDKTLHGTMRSIVASMVKGVVDGFTKELFIEGIGYRAQVQDDILTLQVGFTHNIEIKIPEGIKVEIEKQKQNKVFISGADKEKIGQFAADIRDIKPPEPYKGKGIRYMNEHIQRKAGKSAVGAAAAPGGGGGGAKK